MFALNVFGPAYLYRLELLADACPDITHMMYVLTDKISFEKFYKKYENTFNFVFVEDIQKDFPLSIEHEIIPNGFETEEQQFAELEGFYKSKNNYFSYDIHRFIFPFFIKKGIKKFFIIDSDCIPTNRIEDIKYFFENLPEKTIFGPAMGYDFLGHNEVDLNHPKQLFWKRLKFKKYTDDFEIHMEIPHLDGWVRGFNFSSIEDMDEFFQLWNTAYLTLLDERFSEMPLYKNGEGPIIWSTEWIFSHSINIFEKFKNYSYNGNITQQPGVIVIDQKLIAVHAPRPEDNLFYKFNGRRGAWWDYKFEYDGIYTISKFIMKNKDELERYYKAREFQEVKITDTHAFTRTRL